VCFLSLPLSHRRSTISTLLFLASLAATVPLAPIRAQAPQAASAPGATAPANTPSNLEQSTVGDSPDNPGPLATDVSPALTHAAISSAAEKVASWELARTQPTFNRLWTYAALYDGFLAASKTTGDPRFHDAMVRMSDGFGWKLINDRFPHADDMALGKTYMDLYLDSNQASRDPGRTAHTKEVLDQLLSRPDDPSKLLWWWCDALYMAPPVLASMAEATGDRRYLDYMDKEWWETSASLYDPAEHLFFRDSRYFTQKQKNGQKIFWSRGNGWVVGGLVKVLSVMPADYPTRPKYIEQFRQMVDRVAAIQGKDGLWRSGLLDPDSYDLPEVSGSGFFTYAMAWGIDQGILDRAKFLPVVTRAWAGLISHIYADGRLGSIQPIDGQPGMFKPSASYVYGVGSFLLAASEVDILAKSLGPQRPHITGISHSAYFVSDLPKALAFWHGLLGYDQYFSLKEEGTSQVRIAFIKINDHQHIELFTDPPTAAPNHMSHLCFTVDNAKQMRDYLSAQGIPVPSTVGTTHAGDYAFEIKDPDGTLIEFVQQLPTGVEAQAAGKFLPSTRIASSIYHVGFKVADNRKAIDFYHKILGFNETWRGSSTPAQLSWINMRVPDGDDYVEFMLYDHVPAQLGGMNHTALLVPDVQQAIATLTARPAFKNYARTLDPHVGKNGKRQVNLFDPDGTRVEIMEGHTVDGKPVPPSTAPPPIPEHQ
jgi:rhamnogalacturonyl hydrolase YesR/catechol 2,3-dioxygenase-like lactoylglutathione lyase family enzyme